MAITAQDVNKLRQMTGAGMMDCKKALVEADGDFDKAIELLRKKGQKVSAARADRNTTEGSVFIQTNNEGNEGIIIGLGCETDFVAINSEFKGLGEEILAKAVEENPANLEELNALSFGDVTVSEKVVEFIGKIGEKIEITAYEKLHSEKVVPYIHAGNKLGVLVGLEGANGTDVEQAGKDVAMQIAAMSPIAVDRDEVDPAVIQKEMEIGRDQAREQGKPENILDKIAEGKVNKFLKENTLNNQKFVKDNSLTIAKYLDGIQSGLKVSKFTRVKIG